MNGFIEFFNFGFLKKLDRYLLLNHTLVWNSKLHYILFWGLVINIPLVSFLILYPMELYQVPTFYNSSFYLSAVVSILALLYWIYKQTKYISVKEYGKFRLSGLKEYLLYFFSIAIISSTPMIIDYIITNNYEYKSSKILEFMELDIINEIENQKILDLTEISRVEEITREIKKVAVRNGSFFYYMDYISINVAFSVSLFMIFIPLLLIIYQNIEIKYFIQFPLLGITIWFVAVLLSTEFRIVFDKDMSILLWGSILLLLTQIVFRNNVRFLLLSLLYLFFSLFLFFDEMNIQFIKMKSSNFSELFSALSVSLLFILVTISFIKNYLIKYASVSKE